MRTFVNKMRVNLYYFITIFFFNMKKILSVLLASLTCIMSYSAEKRLVDYRFAPKWFQSSICFPDDSFKSLVGADGQLLYDYSRYGGNGKLFPYACNTGFSTVIHILPDENVKFQGQQLESAKIPTVITTSSVYGMQVRQTAFASAAFLFNNTTPQHPLTSDREDIVWTVITNNTKQDHTLSPVIVVNTDKRVSAQDRCITIDSARRLISTLPATKVRDNLSINKFFIHLEPVTVKAGKSLSFAVAYDNGMKSDICDEMVANPEAMLEKVPSMYETCCKYWQNNEEVPFGKIIVPDKEISNLLEAAARGIWQAREIKDGSIHFQVGPTCYRGLWVVDGAFLTETAGILGKGDDAHNGIDHILSLQNGEGGFANLTPNFWKENGLVLWTAVRHALLTQNKEWLAGHWEKLSRTVDYISVLREKTYQNPYPEDDGLIPPGAIDGGLWGGDDQPEYSNVLWNMAGMKAMIQAAEWLDKKEDAAKWHAIYDDFYATFQKATERDAAVDSYGNRYLNNMMKPEHRNLPQRALWAFCQSIYPGQIFSLDDEIANGTIDMLKTTLQEGTVMGTGWAVDGIWTYFNSFYGHACLWTGRSEDAANALYAFANHASPVFNWREEQHPRDLHDFYWGDMPHNWGSAEFIRLTVHLLQIDRGTELHLLEGIPEEWLGAGMTTSLQGIATPFGLLTMQLNVAKNGKKAKLTVEPLNGKSCTALVVHTGKWGNSKNDEVITLDPSRKNTLTISLK